MRGLRNQSTLGRINLELEKLRLLLRLAEAQRVLGPQAFAHASAELDAAGRIVGG